MSSMPVQVRVVTWNAQWAKKEPRTSLLRVRIYEEEPEVVCITEGYDGFLDQDGYQITSSPDYGYRQHPGRRKVILWSRNPWSEVDCMGDPSLPPGRFVRGTTETSLGSLTFIGVCIPWSTAHVYGGRKDRKTWDDHLAYLEGLQAILETTPCERLVVLGDFNQRIPSARQPIRVFEALERAFSNPLRIVTEGPIPIVERPSIDHVALSPDLHVSQVDGLNNIIDSPDVIRLSDHFGLGLTLRAGRP